MLPLLDKSSAIDKGEGILPLLLLRGEGIVALLVLAKDTRILSLLAQLRHEDLGLSSEMLDKGSENAESSSASGDADRDSSDLELLCRAKERVEIELSCSFASFRRLDTVL